MARITLLPEERAQLDEWLNEPMGIYEWLAANPNEDPALIYQIEGERDIYELLLAQDGKNIRQQDVTQKMKDAINWVAQSLVDAEAQGFTIAIHQDRMRRVWNWIQANY